VLRATPKGQNVKSKVRNPKQIQCSKKRRILNAPVSDFEFRFARFVSDFDIRFSGFAFSGVWVGESFFE
jgi:hypothetical protein